MDEEFRDKIAEIAGRESKQREKSTQATAGDDGVAINNGGNNNVNIVTLGTQKPREAAWRQPLRQARWRTKQLLASLACGVALIFCLRFVVDHKAAYDAGYRLRDLLFGSIPGMPSNFEALLHALLYGLPLGLIFAALAFLLTWNEDAR